MKRIVKVFTSCIIIGSIVFTAMLSTFAYAPNGVDLVPITMTAQDYLNMFSDGGFYVYYSLSSPTSLDISLFDMESGSSSVVNIGSSSTIYQVDKIDPMTSSSGIGFVFSTKYAYNLRVNANASLQSSVIGKLPFPYYIYNHTFYITSFISGTSTTSASVSIAFKGSDDSTIYSSSGTVNPNVLYWSLASSIMTWYNQRNFSPYVPSGYTLDNATGTGIRTKSVYRTVSSVSTNALADRFECTTYIDSTHTSGTGYDYSFIAPLIFYINFPSTVYVDPDIADEVEEYLDLIVNPSPADQQRIQDLKDEFEAQSDALHDAAEDLHKDMPTLPNVSGLPQEVTEGVEEATQYVITPLFGVGIVGTVVGTCLVFAVIKLLLYGSGPS